MEDDYPVSDAEYRDRLLGPLREELVGRRIVGVRFVSDDEDSRLVPDADAEDGVRMAYRGEEGFETNEIKLCLDDGSEMRLDLMNFSLRSGGWSMRAPAAELTPQPAAEPIPSPSGANPTYERLMVVTVQDGSQLILGVQFANPEHPLRLVFEHEGHSGAEPLPPGDLYVRYVTLGDGHRFIVLLGDDCDDPRVERVELATPYAVGTACRLVKPRYYRRVWMAAPEPFRPGPVTAWWKRGDEILHKVETPPLEWGTAWPPHDP
jgi:hypothetical protein